MNVEKKKITLYKVGNGIGDQGVFMITEALKANSALTSLNLGRNY